MPISRYESSFGGKKGSASKARQAMIRRYGLKEGTRIFYATANARKKARG